MFEIIKTAKQWNPLVVLIEDSASGQSLIQLLKKSTHIPVLGIRAKFDKVSRFAKHTILFETNRILINRSSSFRMNLEEELLGFPKTNHDDQIDALSQGLNYLEERNPINIRQL